MKKILLIIFFFLIMPMLPAFASIGVKSSGTTTIETTKVSRPIQVVISDSVSLFLTVDVIATDEFIYNDSDDKYKIKVSNLYLRDGQTEYPMGYNQKVNLVNNVLLNIGSLTKNYTCTIKNIGVLPPGTYRTDLKFVTNTTLSPSETTYTLEFEIPPTQELTGSQSIVNINLTPENVFSETATVSNVATSKINIKSNEKWKLILDTTDLETLPADYYFLITGGSTNVKDYIKEQTKLLPNNQYVLATGTATVTEPLVGSYINDYINIKYLLKNVSGNYIPEGAYTNKLNYKLQSGD